MEAPTPRKSNRVEISLVVWLIALSTSCLSILLTMSKLLSAMRRSFPLAVTSDHEATARYGTWLRCPLLAGACAARPGPGAALLRCTGDAGCPLSFTEPPAGRHQAGCPSGQRERSVKPSA